MKIELSEKEILNVLNSIEDEMIIIKAQALSHNGEEAKKANSNYNYLFRIYAKIAIQLVKPAIFKSNE